MSTVGKRAKARVSHPRSRLADPVSWDAQSVRPSPYFRWKGGLDRALAAILLVPGLPLIGLLALLVRLTSRGPGIYRQTRVGRHGRRFTLYKLRSMSQDAEAATGAVWCQSNDPRVTCLGRLLRRFHLDELPQLFNVLKGEMSLVGPRPERPEFVRVLAEQIPGYRQRLAVRPGVTGLAQLNLPPDSDLASVCRKLALDIEYVQRAGLWLDVRLLLCTLARMFKIPAVRILGLCRTAPAFDSPSAHSSGGNGSPDARLAPESLHGQLPHLSPPHARPSGNHRPEPHASLDAHGSRKPR